jgi:hypothetical protein
MGTRLAPIPAIPNDKVNQETDLYSPIGRAGLAGLGKTIGRGDCIADVVRLGGTSARAQSEMGETRPRRALADGIITDRLTDKDLRRWNAIKRIVFAEDSDGQPLHPTLRGLWEKLERSGHTIYIEMRGMGRAISNTAGAFHIERLDPEGVRHAAVIRLYPDTIDRAYVGPSAARAEGFIPFLELSQEERYAEVLGHEMAHARGVNPARSPRP